jgi:toxin YoeB
MVRSIILDPKAQAELKHWHQYDERLFHKADQLIHDILKTPFAGLGKPEPLKHSYRGLWSRRITQEHRLIYSVRPDAIHILSFKGHY